MECITSKRWNTSLILFSLNSYLKKGDEIIIHRLNNYRILISVRAIHKLALLSSNVKFLSNLGIQLLLNMRFRYSSDNLINYFAIFKN